MTKEQKKKLVAPIVITALFVGYLIVYLAGVFFASALSTPLLLLLAVPLVGLGGGMVYVLITRIREIRKGEEDDLSNY